MDSNDTTILEYYEKSPYKKWIKLIPPNNKTISFEDYNRRHYFELVADVTLDTEVYATGTKQGTKQGTKKRNTLIQFIPTIPKDVFNDKTEWLYIFTVNGEIVKIGGTRTGLKGRVSSYLCGHHIPERGKSGDCSKTNGFIYNTFEFYLNLGFKIQMFGYALPKTSITINILEKEINVKAQTYHAYESSFLDDYKHQYNEYPVLSDNCDPEYKTSQV